MKKKIINILIKIIFSIVLLLTIGVFVISIESGTAMAISKKGGAFFVNSFSKLEIGKETIISKNTATGGGGVYVSGGFVTFGSYPKTFIISDFEDKKLKESNKSLISETQDENGYYLGTDGKSRYAKVSANPASSSYVFNNGTKIVSGTEYYFKVEPIKWRVLKIENGKALLLCEDVIDAHWFYGSGENRIINNETIYANNYKYSDIRAWLNGYEQETGNTNGENWQNNGFLQKAFTSEERNLIFETTVDNSASTSESETNQYFCDNTNDKIFLIDYQDLINTKNGFNSDYSNNDVMRMKKTTDFSKANGAFSSDASGYSGNCFWWTRSSSLTKPYWVDVVCADGVSKYDSHVSVNARGVVPALWVSESILNTGIGTLVLNGGTITDNTAISGNGHDVYNNGIFTMTGGTVGTNENSQTGYGIYNIGTMNLLGGTIYDNIYSSKNFTTSVNANIMGTIDLENSAIITVQDYSGTTPSYNIAISGTRANGTILILKGNSTTPNLTKLNITGYDTVIHRIIAEQNSSGDWEIKLAYEQYTISLSKGTGISSVSGAGTYDYGTNVTINATLETGYCWKNWTVGTSSTLKSTSQSYTITITESITLTANGEANPYEIEFESNKPSSASGTISGTMANLSMTYDTAKALTANKYSLTGWSFQNWNTKADGTGTTYLDKQSVLNLTSTKGEKVTLYAQWEANTYTVTLNKGTGISAVTGAGIYAYGSSVTISATVSTGYSWSNWSGTHSTTTQSYTFTMPAGNVTDTANATANVYSITLNNQSATSAGTSYIYEKYATGYYSSSSATTSITSITKPTKTGYTFGGYYTSTGGSGTQIITASGSISASNTYFTASTTLYAIWIENSVELPSNWKTEIASTTYMSTIITPTNLASIIFDKTIPSGYSQTPIGYLSTGLGVYLNSSDNSKIAFVSDRIILAPGDSSSLFDSLTNLKAIEFYNFSTKNVYETSKMFNECSALTSLDLSVFDTRNIQYMSSMFYNCSSLTSLNVSSFNMTKVLRMASMFEGCSALTTLDILNFNKNDSSTEKVVNTAYMFKNCSKLSSLDLTGFKTNSVTEMQQMFYGCSALTNLDLSVLNKNGSNTSKVSQMQQMFEGCNGLKSVNLTGFDTSSTTLMYRMFYDCSKLSSLDISSFNTSKVTNMGNMFKGCSSLTSLGVDDFDTSNVAYFDNMFYGCSGLTSLDVSNFNTAKAVNMSHMFASCEKLTTIDVSSFDTSNVTNMSYMFSNCYVVTTLDISEFNTSKVTDMSWMFGNCYAVTELDISGFDTAKVTNMSAMFSCCYVVKSLNFSSFNTSNVTDMSRMFYFCKGLTTDHTNMEKLDLSTFDTQKVTTMTYMFASCQKITAIDLSSFDTSKVTNMSYMFNGCLKLRTPTKKSGDLKTAISIEATSGLTFGVGFTVKNVSNMECMFRNCSTLNAIEKTSNEIVFEIGEKATNMSKMFEGCSSLISVNFSSSSNTSNVTNMSYMFNGCSKITTIDLSSFNTSNVTNMTSMFNGCSSITILYIPFNMAKVTAYGNMLNLGETNKIVEIKTPFTSKTNGEFLLTITTGVEVFYNIEDESEIDVDYHEGFYITSKSEFYKSSKTVELDASCVDQIVSLCRVLKNSISGIRFEKTVPDGYTYKGITENGIYVYYSGNNYAFVSGDVIFAPEDCSEMFKDLICCESIVFKNFKFSKIINVSQMFYNCSFLNELDLSSFDMSGVVESFDMFYNCNSLATLKTPYNVFKSISLGKTMYKGNVGYSSLPQDLSFSVTLTKTATSSFSSKTKQTNQIQETSLDIICEDRRKFILDLSVDNENKIA